MVRLRSVCTRLCAVGALALLCVAPAAVRGIELGDCDGDYAVTIGDLVHGVNIALGIMPVETCPAFDADSDGRVTIDELIGAVNRMLNPETRRFRVRGMIEGFYGEPYTFDQRRDLMRFLASAELNTYMYAPKLDPFHRERWREPYPPAFVDHFGELAAIGREMGVRFVFTLSPGVSFDPDQGDTVLVQRKLSDIIAVGVRDFCLLFDDIAAGSRGADPDVQVDLVSSTLAFLREAGPDTTLCFISNYYNGTAEQFETDSAPFRVFFDLPSSSYYRAYTRIPVEVPIMWTGPGVFTSRLTAADARRFREYVGRPVLMWDNYPVNDGPFVNELHLGAYRSREAGVGDELHGVLLNPMTQPEATKIPLWTAGRFFALGEAYDPAQAWEEALRIVSGGSGVHAVRTVAQQFQGHALVDDDGESPELAARIEKYFGLRSAESEAVLRGLFATFAGNAEALEGSLANPALLAELRDPSRKLSLLGEAGLLALDLIAQRARGEAVEIGVLEEHLAAADEIPWLVGANTPVAPGLALLLGDREARKADVFRGFFDRAMEELRAQP